MRPPATWCPSPNFHPVKSKREISCVVIHATATSGLQSPKEWLCNLNSGVSAHYLIGRDGEVLHLVHELNIAYHAGESAWKNQEHVNLFSVGIELVNANDERQEYPEAQLAACAELTAAICREHGVKLEDVVGHLDVAPGRKTDPAGFPWEDFRARLLAAGIS